MQSAKPKPLAQPSDAVETANIRVSTCFQPKRLATAPPKSPLTIQSIFSLLIKSSCITFIIKPHYINCPNSS